MARKILLADDSVTAQNMGRKILADAGYEVIAVNNGSAALKKIAELKPDLVILDVYMPGYSGLEVCQRLKESQETARIPVLLSVGKLEPFKPEEAQRVRADGYIVKPFEASELLSALSKLEDKVVPRAEPSKPGRFARAMRAAEESSGRNEPSSTETGWKNRIGFPHQKTELEENVAEEAQSANQLSSTDKREKRQKPSGAGTSVDVAALSPTGLPKDVTAEEVAAITAAAAQLQMAGAANKDAREASQYKASEPQASDSPISETSSRERLEAYLEKDQTAAPAVDNDLAATLSAEATTESLPGSDASNPSDRAVSEFAENSHDEKLETDVPVTMAATAESLPSVSTVGPRWTAVSVAVESEEAATSLEHEMQKAYAAFAAADYAPAANSVATSDPSSVEHPELTAENPGERNSNLEPVTTCESQIESAPDPFSVISEAESAVPMSSMLESAAVETHTSATDFATAGQHPSPVDESATMTPGRADSFPPGAPELPSSAAVPVESLSSSSSALESVVHEPEVKHDSETVKSTAAAWASWRQIRDSNNGSETAQDVPTETEVSESKPAELNAKAVAAGAEQIVQQTYSDAPAEKPADVASIVDSVLADLRPKLMEEISRKMAEKK